MRTRGSFVPLPQRFRASCLATDAIGNAVRISGPELGGIYTVSSVDIDASDAFIGIVVSKPSATACVVQSSGTVKGVLSGLTEGERLFVQTDAALAHATPPRPTSGHRTVQQVAIAVSSTDVIIARGLRVRIGS